MERNTNKLIMFDYGGIVEEYSTESKRVYDHRDVLGDAICYACGLTIPEFADPDKWRRELYDRISSCSYTSMEFTGWDSEEQWYVSLAEALQYASCKTLTDGTEAAKRYIYYCKSHSYLVPIRERMLKLEADTKKRCLIGAMTNIGAIWLPTFRKTTHNVGYDYVFESCNARVMKPDPMAYAYVEEMSGLKDQQIMLIDDNYDNVKAAIEYGWCAFWATLDNTVDQIRMVISDFIEDNEDSWQYLTSVPVKQ